MKTIKLSILAALVLTLSLTSCEKDNELNNDLVSSEEIADMTSTALSANSSGLITTVDDLLEESDASLESTSDLKSTMTDIARDTTITRSNPAGTLITYNYSFTYNYLLSLNNMGVPQSLTASYSYSGEFDAPRLASTNTGTGEISVAGFDIASTVYTINGSYSRSGSFESKIRNKNTSTSQVAFDLSDLTANKSTYKIQTGTASVEISGSVSGKGSFSYSGSLTFNGDETATLIIQGVEYLIDLVTGEVTPVN